MRHGSFFERRVGCVLVAAALVLGPAIAEDPSTGDLTTLSLEDLMDIEITSVAKKGQRFSDAAAAIFVVTGEDVRRSGATSIPEALRMVPGVEVARIDSNKWAISARGFNSRFAGKMLVLVDGRSVYSPLFAGVFWDVQDMMLEDLDRIEVIRGPGATLWGANAVNGVINIITKNAAETQGQALALLGGDEERLTGAFRHGGRTGDSGHYRVWAKYLDRDHGSTPNGDDSVDEWDVARAGFRGDWSPGERDAVTVVADVWDGSTGQVNTLPTLTPPFSSMIEGDTDISGAAILTRWEREYPSGASTSLQFSAERTERDDPLFDETRDTADLDFQHRFGVGSRHEIVWGVNYRFTTDDIENTFEVAFDPNSRDMGLVSAFIQDELSFRNGRTRVTFGSKFEHNDSTGFEIQPSVRAFWKIGENRSLWTAISRAVRSPARIFDDVSAANQAFPNPSGSGPVNLVRVLGDRDYDSEDVLSVELGFRIEPSESIYFDIAGYYSHYDDLTTIEMGVPFLETIPIPHVVIPQIFDNLAEGDSKGLEIAAHWRVSPRATLFAAYTLLDMSLDVPPTTPQTFDSEGASPENQLHLRSAFDLPGSVSLDLSLHYVDELKEQGIDSYTRVDVRLGYRPTDRIDVFLVFQDLAEDQHGEFIDNLVSPTEIDRSIYGGITWRF